MNPVFTVKKRYQSLFCFVGVVFSVSFSTVPVSGGEVSLQERVDAAAPGEEIVVDGGVHPGGLVIDRPLTLTGINGAHIRGDRSGHTVAIRAEDVTLRGFRISGSGLNLSADHAAVHVGSGGARILDNDITDSLHGVYIRGVDGVRVANNRIRGVEETAAADLGPVASATFGAAELCSVSRDRRGNGIHFWKSAGNTVTGNEISGVRDGIYFSFTRQSRVENNVVYGVRYGLHYMYSDNNYLSRNRFTRNAAGAALMFSKSVVLRHNEFVGNRGPRAYGLLLHNVDGSTIENNRMSENRVGYYMQNSHANTARGNDFVHNYVGLRLTSNSANNLFTRNRIGRNLHNIDLAGRERGNRWEENGAGNRWLDSPALDLDRDGVSELVHREVDLFGASREAFPFITFLSESPGMQALRFALQRSPVPGTHFITDSRPLAPSAGGSEVPALEAGIAR